MKSMEIREHIADIIAWGKEAFKKWEKYMVFKSIQYFKLKALLKVVYIIYSIYNLPLKKASSKALYSVISYPTFCFINS